MAHKPHMGGHKGRKHRASGGRTAKGATHEYNAEGSPAMRSATDETDDGFKRGGRKRHKAGGHVEGEAAKHRLDKRRASGGKMEPEHHKAGGKVGHHKSHGKAVHHGRGMKHYAAGGSPMSSAAHTRGPDDSKGAGHESEHVSDVP